MRMGGVGSMHMSGFRTGDFRTGGLAFRRIGYFHPHWWHPHWQFGWRHPYWIAPVVGGGVAASYAATPTSNRCNCLTKEYTPEGAVVFKDVCTQEMAMNPPANGGPSVEDSAASQQPQQQGYAQPQQGYLAPQPQAQPYAQYR
jgi:hypothetical protein